MRNRLEIGRTALAVALFLTTIEFCARLDDYLTYGAPILSSYSAADIYTFDALGRRGKPNARYRKWGLNALGFRGSDLQPETIRIVCFGASETFGLYENEGKEYPRQLEEALNRGSGRRFQVINAAYPGESLQTAAERAPEIVAAVHPRLALIYGVPSSYIWMPYLAAKPSPEPPASALTPRLDTRVRTFLISAVPGRLLHELRKVDIQRSSSGFAIMQRLPERNVEKYSEDMKTLAARLLERGVRPVILTHVSAFGPNAAVDRLPEDQRRLLTAWRRFFPMLDEPGFLDMEDRMNDAARGVAAEGNLPLIDLARMIPPSRAYFADFGHFTEPGAALMAERIRAGLERASEGL